MKTFAIVKQTRTTTKEIVRVHARFETLEAAITELEHLYDNVLEAKAKADGSFLNGYDWFNDTQFDYEEQTASGVSAWTTWKVVDGDCDDVAVKQLETEDVFEPNSLDYRYREAAKRVSREVYAILNESLGNESPAYSSAQFEDDNGQMIDVMADALGYQTHRKNADDFEGIVGEATQSNLMVVLDNLQMFVGREASWTGGFNPESYANKQKRLAIAGIEDIVLDSNGKARKPTKTGKVRRAPVARRKTRK